MTQFAWLPSRGVIEVLGRDRVAFLQGLVSNDMEQVAPGHAVWAALLTPQGKYLADFFVFADGARLLLDCEAGQVAGLVQRLGRFRLRAQVSVAAAPGWRVYAGWNGPAPGEGLVSPDPRWPAAGFRMVSEAPLAVNADAAAYDAHRLALGLPDGTRDLEVEKSVLLEAGFDALHGVSWSKGCYMGQELTARTKYRGLLKRRLVPVEILGVLPAPGTAIFADGREVGVLRSGLGVRALALLRLDALTMAPLLCGGVALVVRPPAWMIDGQ